MQAECPRPASEKARLGSVCLLPRSEDVGFPSWGGGVTQPCVSPGLFLAPKPLLRSGCEYRSPLPVLWLWPSARTLLCAWTGGRPAPCLPPPSAGIWANSPTPKKVPPDPSGFNSCNKHSRHLLLCARPCAADSVDFAAGQAEACLLLDPESAVTLRGHAPGRQAWRAVLAG